VRAALDRIDAGAAEELLDLGTSSLVLRFGTSVVRIPRNAHSEAGHRREALLLPHLQGRLPVRLATPCRSVPPSPGLPRGALIQPLLPGRVMRAEDAVGHPQLVHEIVDALASLHAIPATDLPAGLLPRIDPEPYVNRLADETAPLLRDQLSASLFGAFRERVRDVVRVARSYSAVVCHGDAWFGNMLIHAGHLSAVLDLEDACIADPALDLAPFRYLGQGILLDAVQAYAGRTAVEPNLLERTHAYGFVRELAGLAYALNNDLKADVAEGVAKLLDGLGAN
jgi:macrolide phosphotransferase